MPIIRIGQYEVDVDIEAELQAYDWGYNARWSTDKLIAASPFRHDSTPSFFCHLETGGWADSGATDDDYVKGGFVKLLAYLRDASEAETADYLLGEYGRLYAVEEGEEIRLPEIRLKQRTKHAEIAPESVRQAVSPYLTMRGISPDVQREFGVGYGAEHPGFTALPWHSPEGRLANIKYRSTSGKRFFYEKGATPVRTLVYGLDIINRTCAGTAVLCEGEIDAMSWATAGIPAIACGGSSISNEQIDAIKRSSIRRMLLGGDNDPAGQRLNKEIKRRLAGHVELYDVDYGAYNDANDVLKACGGDGLRNLEDFSLSKLNENYIQLRNVPVI